MSDFKDYTIYIRNFDSKQVSHDLLLELFTQAGPVQNLKVKEDFAFLEFEDKDSVIYACNLLNDTELFGIPLQVKPRKDSCWEKVELHKFPNINNYNDNDSRSVNDNYNEYRQNSRSNNNSFNESDYRQNHRSSYHENVNNMPNNNYYEDHRHNARSSQINNFNEMNNIRSHTHHHNITNYMESDYNWQGNNRFSVNNISQDNRPVDNQAFFNNFEYRKQRSSIEMHSQNRGFNVYQDRRQLSTENLWNDRGANMGCTESGPTFNKSFGNYRNRPY